MVMAYACGSSQQEVVFASWQTCLPVDDLARERQLLGNCRPDSIGSTDHDEQIASALSAVSAHAPTGAGETRDWIQLRSGAQEVVVAILGCSFGAPPSRGFQLFKQLIFIEHFDELILVHADDTPVTPGAFQDGS